MSAKERYELLNDLVWNLPTLGLQYNARMLPTERIPELFADGRDSADRLVKTGFAKENALATSLLEWTIRDGIATGNEDQIKERIAEIEASGSDDAKLAHLVLGLAKTGALDLSLLTEKGEDGSPTLVPCLGSTGPVIPLDLVVAQFALESDEHHDAGRDLLNTLLERAIKNNQYSMIAWTRSMIANESDATSKPTTSQQLSHWVVSNEYGRNQLMDGNCLLYTSPSPRDATLSRMPSSA